MTGDIKNDGRLARIPLKVNCAILLAQEHHIAYDEEAWLLLTRIFNGMNQIQQFSKTKFFSIDEIYNHQTT